MKRGQIEKHCSIDDGLWS